MTSLFRRLCRLASLERRRALSLELRSRFHRPNLEPHSFLLAPLTLLDIALFRTEA